MKRFSSISFNATALILALGLLGCDAGVDPNLPEAPTLAFPLNGEANLFNALELVWNTSSGSDEYHMRLAKDPSFSEVEEDVQMLTGTQYTVTDLDIGQTYYWQVRGVNGSGVSEWAEARTFRVTKKAAKPAIPSLSLPLDGSEDMPETVYFEWNPIDGATRYHLQVSLESNFIRRSADLEHVRGSRQRVTQLVPTYVYFWRVKAINPVGESSWSPTWKLVIKDEF